MSAQSSRRRATRIKSVAWGALLLTFLAMGTGEAKGAEVCRYDRPGSRPGLPGLEVGMGFTNRPHDAWKLRQTYAIGDFVLEAGIKVAIATGEYPENVESLRSAWSSLVEWNPRNLYTHDESNPIDGSGLWYGQAGYVPVSSQGNHCGCTVTLFGRVATIATLTIGCGTDPPAITRAPRTLEDRLAEDAAKAK